MKTHNNQLLSIQLFQFKPKDFVLESEASLIIENLHFGTLENQLSVITKIKSSKTLGELFLATDAIADAKFRRRFVTSIWNTFIECSSFASDLRWDKQSRSIQIGDTVVLKEGEFRDIESAQCVKFSFDHFEDGVPVFIVKIKNQLRFSKPVQAIDFHNFLSDRREFYLPSYDKKKNFNCVLRKIEFKEVYRWETKSIDNPKPMRIGERFINAGRMNQDEYNKLELEKEKFSVAICTPYNKKKRYSYPARDIELVASDGLLSLENKNQNAVLPEELKEAISLYRHAKVVIHDEMAARTNILNLIKNALESIVDLAKPIEAERQGITKRRLKLKNRAKVNQEIKSNKSFYCDDELEFGKNVLCYPSANNINLEGKEDKFKKFFSPGSKITNFGLIFEPLDYTVESATKQPIELAEYIVNSVPDCCSALLVWPNWPHLPNNKMIEFELMRRGIAVQNVVNQNFKDDAPKIPALIKGMAEKFPTKIIRKADEAYSLAPFDYALGLDVSRHDETDVASFPIVVDAEGIASCLLSQTPYTVDKEKRSESEIIDVINRVVTRNSNISSPINILFLRDGFAYENYDLIAAALPKKITLTVVSVRKNLMGVCGENLESEEPYSLHSVLDEQRFVFGINARQGSDAKVSQMHLAEVVCNPLNVGMDTMANILISLSCQNKTTETEIASLPFPIAYADRMAWTIRDMIQDNQLLKHVRENYAKECDAAGGPALFIYSELKRFVETRVNGYTFAI